jgi:hypothetical protein
MRYAVRFFEGTSPLSDGITPPKRSLHRVPHFSTTLTNSSRVVAVVKRYDTALASAGVGVRLPSVAPQLKQNLCSCTARSPLASEDSRISQRWHQIDATSVLFAYTHHCAGKGIPKAPIALRK